MEITTITLTISSVVLLLAAVSPMVSPLFRLPKKDEEDSACIGESKDKPISVVIISHDNAPELEKHLPAFLSQKYNADYQVIVVADKSDSDVIKRFSNDPHLYATFMPLSSRYISRKKLAITLGIKAAKYPWVIITDAWCTPESDEWLRSFASHINDSSDVVLGYSNYEEDAPSHFHYENIIDASQNLRLAQKNHAYASASRLVAIKKENFLAQDGFLGNLKYMRGEYDFLVNKFGRNGNTATAFTPSAFLSEDTPFSKRWSENHLFAINTGRHLDGHWLATMIRQIDFGMMNITNLAIIAAITYGALKEDWITLGAGILALIIEYVGISLVAKRAFKRFQCLVNPFLTPLMAFYQPLRNFGWRLRYYLANKNDFITHKI